jgi:hypothetical protein
MGLPDKEAADAGQQEELTSKWVKAVMFEPRFSC